MPVMQLRLSGPSKGVLRLTSDRREIWSHAVNLRQERGLLIPLKDIAIGQLPKKVQVSLGR